MKRIKWLGIAWCLLGFCAFMVCPVSAEERKIEVDHPEDWVEISGELESIDLDTSRIIVKVYQDEDESAYEEDTIFVTQEAQIVKFDTRLSLRNLRPGNKIVVRYNIAENGEKEAYYIWVKE